MISTIAAPTAETKTRSLERIIVVRHGRPRLDRDAGPRINWRQYQSWWATYEETGLADGQTPPLNLLEAAQSAPVVLSSTRLRARETAAKIAAGRPILEDPIYVEAPLPPPPLPWVRFLPRTWNKLARLAWMIGHAPNVESLAQAEARAAQAAATLDERANAGEVVVLCAHGWFNRMLRPHLRARGWKCVIDGGDRYWSFRVYHRAKAGC